MDVLKSIHVFQQVVDAKSFTGAADRLNLVPSAVSRQINELESWLGVRLINRTTRSLHLTDQGRNYLAKMAAITSHVNDLKSSHEEINHLVGKVNISSPVMLGQNVIPHILSAFKVEHPDVEVSLTLLSRKVDLVEEGYDLAIRVGNLADSNFHAKQIGLELFKTVASQSYLDNSAPINTPRDLRQHNCLINTASSTPRRWLYQIDGSNKVVKIDGSMEANDAFCIRSFARAGLGVALLPERYINDELESGDLVEVLGDFSSAPLPINIIYPSNRLMSVTQRVLIDFLARSFNEVIES